MGRVKNNKPELLLLDIMLPKEDGISILKKIRVNGQLKKIQVIMLTAKDTEFDVVTGLDTGASRVSRYSSTMTKKTLYFAKKLPNGDILRISNDKHSIWVFILGMSQLLFIMFVVAIIISAVFTSIISKRKIQIYLQIK